MKVRRDSFIAFLIIVSIITIGSIYFNFVKPEKVKLKFRPFPMAIHMQMEDR